MSRYLAYFIIVCFADAGKIWPWRKKTKLVDIPESETLEKTELSKFPSQTIVSPAPALKSPVYVSELSPKFQSRNQLLDSPIREQDSSQKHSPRLAKAESRVDVSELPATPESKNQSPHSTILPAVVEREIPSLLNLGDPWTSPVPLLGYPLLVVCKSVTYTFVERVGRRIFMESSEQNAELILRNDCKDTHSLSHAYAPSETLCFSPEVVLGDDPLLQCIRSKQMLLVKRRNTSTLLENRMLHGDMPLHRVFQLGILTIHSMHRLHQTGIGKLETTPDTVLTSGTYVWHGEEVVANELEQMFLLLGFMNPLVFEILMKPNFHPEIRKELEKLKSLMFKKYARINSNEINQIVDSLCALVRLTDANIDQA